MMPSNILEFFWKVYGGDILSRTRVFAWHTEFHEGCESIQSQRVCFPKSNLNNSDNIATMRDLVEFDRCRSISELSSNTGLSFHVVRIIQKYDMGLSELSVRWVPGLFTAEHKANRLNFLHEWRQGSPMDFDS